MVLGHKPAFFLDNSAAVWRDCASCGFGVGDLTGVLFSQNSRCMDLGVQSGHGGWQQVPLWDEGAVPVPSSSQPPSRLCSSSSLARWWLSWVEAVELQGIIFSLVSRGKAAYVIVLSVSAFPHTSLLSTSFEPPVRFSGRNGELQDVMFLHISLQISSWGHLPPGGDEAGWQHPGTGRGVGEGAR